mgnify:CR=1 FL=1
MATHKEKIKLSTLVESVTGYRVLPLTEEIKQELEPVVQQEIGRAHV